MGPLLFLKIEGDKHFFPSSKSLISSNLCLFFVSVSEGSPFLKSLNGIKEITVVCPGSNEGLQCDEQNSYAVSQLPPKRFLQLVQV